MTKKKASRKAESRKTENKKVVAKQKTTIQAEKAEEVKSRKIIKIDYKSWLMAGLAVVALVIIVVLILNFSRVEQVDSSYFHDSDGKIVLTMDQEISELDNSEYEPPITHVVYYHDGNKVTGARAYYEYATDEAAKEAYDNLSLGDFAENMRKSGRFVIFQVKSEMYDGLSVEELQENVELLKQIDALILDYDENTIEKAK